MPTGGTNGRTAFVSLERLSVGGLVTYVLRVFVFSPGWCCSQRLLVSYATSVAGVLVSFNRVHPH